MYYNNPYGQFGPTFQSPMMGYQMMYPSQMQFQQRRDFYDEAFFAILDKEILEMKDDIQKKLSTNEKERMKAVELITQIIRSTYYDPEEKIDVSIYGSMVTGLAIDSSDLDLLVSGVLSNQETILRIHVIKEMQKLHYTLGALFGLETNSLIDTATVPVIKLSLDLQKIRKEFFKENNEYLSEELQFLKVDITFNDLEGAEEHQAPSKHLGLKCAKYI
mmetsp:Transcript_3333/g.3308  ORF Transcript_3333/g.3308 Transcript_3333/m.3308 type:complete len:218 (+) Transcript_3333:41-694(+)